MQTPFHILHSVFMIQDWRLMHGGVLADEGFDYIRGTDVLCDCIFVHAVTSTMSLKTKQISQRI